jgi:hypothetical protein
VLLAVVRDRPYADVAATLDIPVGTVKSRCTTPCAAHARPPVSFTRIPITRRAIQHCHVEPRGGLTVYSCNGLHTPVHQEEK